MKCAYVDTGTVIPKVVDEIPISATSLEEATSVLLPLENRLDASGELANCLMILIQSMISVIIDRPFLEFGREISRMLPTNHTLHR